MLQKYVFFLSLFLAVYCRGNVRTQRTPKPLEKIGMNMTAQIYIYFNSSYAPDINAKSRSEDESANTTILPMFTKLFTKVQENFHNKSVMINFTVNVTEENDNIAVYFSAQNISLNATGTLEKLLHLKSSLAKEPLSIVFYYTNYTLLKEETRGDRIPHTVQYAATRNTFCTSSPSGAVVKHDPNSTGILNTVSALSEIFDVSFSRRRIHPLEHEQLKEKLKKCPAN
uniref:28 kDa Metastriate family member n=1 Tax=Rhipicephalus zambeziensis TaxID=60191 RepID=A0A224Y0U8_9ACAR